MDDFSRQKGIRMKKSDQKRISFWNVCCNWLFPAFLLLYPLRHINWGLDLGDIGYNYSNFQYMGIWIPCGFFLPIWLMRRAAC